MYTENMLELFSGYATEWLDGEQFLRSLWVDDRAWELDTIVSADRADAADVSVAAHEEFVELLEAVQRDMTALQREIDELQAKLAALPLSRAGPNGAEIVALEDALESAEAKLRFFTDTIRSGKSLDEQRRAAEQVMLALVSLDQEVQGYRTELQKLSTT